MATITGASPMNAAPADLRLTPEAYTTVDTLLKANKDFVIPELVQSYGDQGITGFLRLTGAVNNGGTSDQVDWWEAGRRHTKIDAVTFASAAAGSAGAAVGTVQATVDTSAMAAAGEQAAHVSSFLQASDVVMSVNTGSRYIVQSASTATDPVIILERLDGGNGAPSEATTTSTETLIHLGNMYAQGTDQPTKFTDPDIVRRKNPFMIVKDRYQVNGSQATNIGWVNMGGGDFRWFMYGEQEARKRFEDRREMMMLFAEKNAATADDSADLSDNIAGSEGYFSAIESRGINISNANANPIDSFAEFDDIILELDKNGATSEYAMYVNRKQDLAIDDMLASGISTGTTAGLAGQFGAFNNDADMAVKLGFKSFTRGGYTFHKHDWKLLNDPTLLGASTKYQGAMIPMSQIADARTGVKAPSLAMYYKEANGYNREMEHWVTGGGVLGHNNNGDAGKDVATFHYRSEIALCVRAANQHVVIKG
jgi:hypothetical protein